MAHIVKCSICGNKFDRDKEEYSQTSARRYAHKKCFENLESEVKDELQAETELYSYIKQLFSYDTIPSGTHFRIKNFKKINNFSYRGILNSLKYFYEVKGNKPDLSKGDIGIVPYVYDQAERYYKATKETKEKNEKEMENIQEIKIDETCIKITSQKRNPMNSKRNFFNFLNERDD